MQTELLYGSAFTICRVTLHKGEQIRADAGAMVSMAGVSIATAATGGFLESLGRTLLGGESFFQNVFTAEREGAELVPAPPLPGDITVLPLDGELIVQSGSFLAGELGVDVTTEWGGAKTFFGGEGLFMLRCMGTGRLILSSYGAIHTVTIPTGEQYTVDSGHLVAFPVGMPFEVGTAGSWQSTILGGEGLVVNLTGPGDIHLQTRSQAALLDWLIPRIPQRSSDG